MYNKRLIEPIERVFEVVPLQFKRYNQWYNPTTLNEND